MPGSSGVTCDLLWTVFDQVLRFSFKALVLSVSTLTLKKKKEFIDKILQLWEGQQLLLFLRPV